MEALSEALAQEVKPLGINVTIVEPGLFATGFGSALVRADGIADYADIHTDAEKAIAEITGAAGDPADTVAALLRDVDADDPPLRLLIGAGMLTWLTGVYEDRIARWTTWSEGVVA